MESFTEREKGFEAEFKRHEELRFRVTARRNRLFGLWAARRLDLTAEAGEAYAKPVIAADFKAPGDGDVIEKVRTDLEEKGSAVNDAELRSEFARGCPSPRADSAVLNTVQIDCPDLAMGRHIHRLVGRGVPQTVL